MSNLFTPSTIRQLSQQGHSFKSITRSQITESSPPVDNIWSDDPYGTGLRSTQQIDLDWSDFTNHTFFNSAESKVNVAFDRAINHYPFDGSKSEVHEYLESLSGYERHVLKYFPRHLGDIRFSKGSNQYITSQDKSGYLFPEISKNKLGERSIGSTASAGKFTIEFWMYHSSSLANDTQTIFQKLNTSKNHGISLFLSKSLSSDKTVPVLFGISSGSISVSGSFNVTKGSYQHLAFVYDTHADKSIKVYNNGTMVSSVKSYDINELNFLDKNIYIGSGSSQTLQNPSLPFVPKETLNINLDEFRFWKSARNQTQINTFYHDNIFQNNDLALYYRFNEPTGSYGSKTIALDFSGNGLHGQIANFAASMRGTKLQSQLPMKYERSDYSPVLFPDHPDLVSLNSKLLTSASIYDSNNPNLITKLVPSHYFLEGQAFDGLEDEFGKLGENYSNYSDGAFPGNGKIPTSQILSSFLFIWASFFDEIKVYIDSFSKMHDLSHSPINSVPAQFLQKLGKRYGLNLPSSFTYASIDSYSHGKDLTTNSAYSKMSLRKLQEHLWRRLLAELPSIYRMKGTIQSIKSTMLSLGINPDVNFRIREYGGNKTKRLVNNFKPVNSWFNSLDFSIGSPFLQSKDILVGYRHEPGVPFGAGTAESIIIDHMGAESSTIRLAKPASVPKLTAFTSASWAWEANYTLKSSVKKQSLFRLEHSASLATSTKPSICVNLIAVSGSFQKGTKPKLILAFSGSKASKLFITGSGINVHDGSDWWINVNHIARSKKSEFLVRAYKTNGREIVEKHYMSGTYSNSLDNGSTHERNRLTAATNQGNRLAIGYKAPSAYTSDLLSYSGDNETNFNGKVASLRFWTKALDEKEAKAHALNPFSVGSTSPLINSGYLFEEGVPIHKRSVSIPSGSLPLGSWERLRLAADLNQAISASNSTGQINIVDSSKNSAANNTVSPNTRDAAAFFGYNFTNSTLVFNPIQKLYSILDPDYDVNINVNKARIASFQDPEMAEDFNAENLPVYDLDPRKPLTDDRRFSIEASLVMALNQDITNVLADNQYINDAIGTPEQMFAINYPALERLGDKYFNRLTDKINSVEYFKFFKWFDNNFGQIVEKLIPRTTEFLGINFVIESHMLERHRLEYKQADVHIDLNSRLAATVDPVLEGVIKSEVT